MAITNGSGEPQPQTEVRGFERRHRRSIFFPLLLVAAGGLLLLSNMGVLGPEIWSSLIRLWPLLIIVGALDGIYRGEGLAGQIFWLGLGVLFLLASLGYLSVNIWDLLLRFWPVFLIAIGIDILLGSRREAWARALAVLLSLALLAGVVWFAGANFTGRGATLQSSSVSQALPDANAASYNLSMGAGLFEISGGAPAGKLVNGEVRSVRQRGVRESVTELSDRVVYTLKDESVPVTLGNNNDRHWTMQLSSQLPAALDVTLGAGQARIDLGGMKLESVDATVAVGEMDVVLPAQGEYSAEFTTAIGKTVIRVPQNAAVEIRVDGIFPIDVNGEGLTLNGRTVTATGSGPVTRVMVLNIIGSTTIERVR